MDKSKYLLNFKNLLNIKSKTKLDKTYFQGNKYLKFIKYISTFCFGFSLMGYVKVKGKKCSWHLFFWQGFKIPTRGYAIQPRNILGAFNALLGLAKVAMEEGKDQFLLYL